MIPGPGRFTIWPTAADGLCTDYDPYWDNVVLAMHMNGVNNGTTFTDTKDHTFTVDGPVYGDGVYTSTAQSMFNGSSCYFNGNSALLSPDSEDWYFPGDFTIRMFVRPSVLGGFLIAQYNSSLEGAFGLKITAGGELDWWEWASSHPTTGANIQVDTWVHVEVGYSISSSLLKVFVSGIERLSEPLDLIMGSSSQQLTIGSRLTGGSPLPTDMFTGYIAELVIYKGVCLHTTNFEPPTLPFYEAACTSGTTPAPPDPGATPHISTVELGGSFIPYQQYRVSITPNGGSPYYTGWQPATSTTLAEYAAQIASTLRNNITSTYYKNLTSVTSLDNVVTVEALYAATVYAEWIAYPGGSVFVTQEAHGIAAGSSTIYSIAPFIAGTLSSGWASGYSVTLKVRLLTSDTWLLDETVSCSGDAGYDAIIAPLQSAIAGSLPSDLTFALETGSISATQVDIGPYKYRIEATCTRCPMSVGLTQDGTYAYPAPGPQVSEFTYGNSAYPHEIFVGQVFTITINASSFAYTAMSGDDPYDVHTALVALINAGSEPVTGSVGAHGTDYCVSSITADADNVPFAATFTTTAPGRVTTTLVQEFSAE